jgi:TolA-binding protein
MASRAVMNRQRSASTTSNNGNSAKSLFYEKLLEKLEEKSVLPPPRIFVKGHHIENHLADVERYIKTIGARSEVRKTSTLLNSLDESVQLEIYAQPHFEENQDSFEWLVSALKNLYGRKDLTMSPRIHLLNIVQKADQSVIDYGNTLRVEAYRCWPREDTTDKESFLVKAFLLGLSNKKMSLAIKALKPHSLEEALSHAKCHQQSYQNTEFVENENFVRRMYSQQENTIIKQMQDQILELQKKVNNLETLLNFSNNSRFVRHNEQRLLNRHQNGEKKFIKPAANRNSEIECYNCHQYGHIARNCLLKKQHRHDNVGKYERPPFRRQFIRQMQEDQPNEISETESILNVEQSEVNEDADCCTLQLTNHESYKPLRKPNMSRGFARHEVENARKWITFIEGNGKRPKTLSRTSNREKQGYAQTLISSHHSETARNKPIIMGRCAGQKTQLFLDSGAETNVIDSRFLKELQNKQIPIEFIQSKANIKCANGTRMPIMGYANLSVEIGPIKAKQRFMVVNELFPRIIIGIRTLKTMGVVISPTEDCIFVPGGCKVSFLSRVDPQSECTIRTGKELGPR